MHSTALDILADELGAVAGRIEKDARLRVDTALASAQARFAELHLQTVQLERRVETAIATQAEAVASRLAALKDGLPGAQGDQGARGERGDPGEPGAPGAPGGPGERGEDGRNGEQGEQGDPGERGAPGAPGWPGESGKDGDPGLQGLKGDPGDQGDKGDQGERGERGERGQNGEDGKQGNPGAPGGRGEKGQSGDRGEQGLQGDAGQQGERGKRGKRGEAGTLPAVREWTDQVHYSGNVVSLDGSTYQAQRDTGERPPHADWHCLAARGVDAYAGEVRGLYDPSAKYRALDIVIKDDCEWRAVIDDPGDLPGPGWRRGAGKGKPGQRGEKGERGERGEPGTTAVLKIVSWKIQRRNYSAVAVLSDGTEAAPLQLRELFEQFSMERN